MFGIFFAAEPPDNYRAWKTSTTPLRPDGSLPARFGIIVEPDSREPWFICEAHGLDGTCLTDTLKAVERAVDLTLQDQADGKLDAAE